MPWRLVVGYVGITDNRSRGSGFEMYACRCISRCGLHVAGNAEVCKPELGRRKYKHRKRQKIKESEKTHVHAQKVGSVIFATIYIHRNTCTCSCTHNVVYMHNSHLFVCTTLSRDNLAHRTQLMNWMFSSSVRYFSNHWCYLM